MRLKKHYRAGTVAAGKPEVAYVEIERDSKLWKPSVKIVERGLFEGWLRLERGTLVMLTGPDTPDLQYRILAFPGRYCCHCGERLSSQAHAKGHVAGEHKGVESPSNEHPAGYARQNFYLVERIGGG